MPRDSNGNYSLPAGNPVVTLTVISSTWANTTMSDISTALTGSLDRSGQGSMLAGLKLFDGTIGGPGLTWGTETTAGIYRAAAGDFRFAIGGADVFRFQTAGVFGLFTNGSAGAPAVSWLAEPTTGMFRNAAGDIRYSVGSVELLRYMANLFQVSGTTPVIRINESDASANNRLWDILANAEDLVFRTIDDALAVANAWLAVNRTGAAVDAISFGNATNNPTYAFVGSGVATFSGQAVFAGVPGSSLAASLRIEHSGNPLLAFYQTGAGSNEKLWDIVPVSAQLLFRTANDAGAGNVTWLSVNRTGTTIDEINFENGTLQYGGFEVGYRNLIHRSFSGNDNSVASDRGRAVQYTGTGGHTFTFDTDLGANHIVTVMNMGNGNLTIAETLGGTLGWMNGSGTISTGSRTLAVGGWCTVWYQDASNAFITGVGLT